MKQSFAIALLAASAAADLNYAKLNVREFLLEKQSVFDPQT